MTRVLVAAASPVVRAGLEALLAGEPALSIVAGAADANTLAQQVADVEPDVVLLELSARDGEPLPPLPTSSTAGVPSIVLLADEPDATWVGEALRAGARAILPRDASGEAIVAAVLAAAAGLVSLDASLSTAVLAALPASPKRASNGESELTPREIEVLGMLAEGLGNKQIAGRLAISEHTVKFHVGSIFGKLHAASRAEAVMAGARLGLIML